LRLAALNKRLEANQQAIRFPRWTYFIAAALVLAACGGADTVDEPDPATQTSAAVTDAAPQPTTTAPEGVPAPELAGTSWRVTDYSQGTGIITNVWLTEVTIAFAGDGTVSGSGGCNEYQGTWEAEGTYDEFVEGVPDANDGQVMTLTDLIWTEVACEDERIMEQQEEFFALLQRAGRWVIRYGNFNLRSSDGNFLFEAEPAG
jgi:heat shock protein HslJ